MSRKPHKLLSIKLKATKKTTSQKNKSFMFMTLFCQLLSKVGRAFVNLDKMS